MLVETIILVENNERQNRNNIAQFLTHEMLHNQHYNLAYITRNKNITVAAILF